ncbi:MAG: ATP-binding domain-containing protein [Deltaproteobacteria bacterium]|jgi:hypothetical protein|nr:ATP-binding domain-containing protein [Deltaproteobacteria bacterium]
MSELSHDDIITLGLEAKGILEVCDRIAEASRQYLGQSLELDFGPSRPESARLRGSDSYKALRCLKVPIVARIGAKDEANRTRVYYVCPCDPPPGCRRAMLVNLFSPFGRILATRPGDIFVTPEGERLAITEKTTLTLEDYGAQKDVFDALFERQSLYKIHLKSLRDVLARLSEPRYSHKRDENHSSSDDTSLILEGEADEIEVEYEEEGEILSSAPVIRWADKGLKLMDPPLLDPKQDKICREPLGSRILIAGPAGVGKTMTMIRALDFKITRECLAGEEEAIVDQLEEAGYLPHAISWRLFTPTTTLARYAKSSFLKRLIPGYDENIVSWAEYRKYLARELFGILQTPQGGKLILSSNLNYLTNQAKLHTDRWFDDFNQFHWQSFVGRLKEHAERLAGSPDHNLSSLGARSREDLEQTQTGALARLYLALAPRVPTISGYDGILSKSVLELTNQVIQGLTEQDPNFLLDMADFYETLPKSPVRGAAKEPEPDSEEAYHAAYNFLAKIIREKSRAVALGQDYTVDARRTKFWEFLSGRIDETSLAPLGQNCLLLSSLRKLNCSTPGFSGSYFESLVESYLNYRHLGGEWYGKAGIDNLYVNELELDVILLAFLEASSALLWQDYLKPGRFPLGSILLAHKGESRNQILVDEAVDFSPVELKCMMNLTVPSSGSFSVTADLNQRFTPWGVKSIADFEWAAPGLVENPLTANYRVSSPLDALAQAVASKSAIRHTETTQYASLGTYKPVMLPQAETFDEQVAWVASRIQEIKRLIGRVPAIAVVMNSETSLGALADSLSKALEDLPPAAVYRESEFPEVDSPIRVFNLKHIKGLEFEAVFLLELDKLALSCPDLYKKFLYAAITRAATFFGVTCQEAWPTNLAHLTPLFGENWAE